MGREGLGLLPRQLVPIALDDTRWIRRQMGAEKVRGNSPRTNRDPPDCFLLQRLVCSHQAEVLRKIAWF